MSTQVMHPQSRIPRISRRAALESMGAGFGSVALAAMLAEEASAESLGVRPPHFAPKAKRVIMLFMFGGPSHIDTFDPKPILKRDHGKPLPFAKPRVISFPRRAGDLIGSPFEFRKHGESGAEVSELLPAIAGIVDDLTIVRSMHCTNPRHGGAVLEWHTGSDTFIRPSMGSWLTYGLGTENRNVPGYITICQALAEGGANNYGSAFLPAAFQGTPLGYGNVKAKDAAFPFIGDGKRMRLQRMELDMLADVSRHQLNRIGPDSELESRIATLNWHFACRPRLRSSRTSMRDRRRYAPPLRS